MNRPRIPCGRSVPVCAAAFLVLALSGCSSVPDWANPVEWYRGATGIFDSDSSANDEARASAKAGPGTDANYPNLSTVPDRPRDIASPSARTKVEQGLVADRSQARYAALGKSPSTTPPAAAPQTSAAGSGANWAPKSPATAPSPTPAPAATGDQVSKAYQQALRQSATGGAVEAPAPPAPEALAPGPVRRNVTPLPEQRRSRLVLTPPATAQQQAATSTPGPGGSYQVGTVYFANGSSSLSGKSINLLKSIAKMYKSKGGSLRVVGHASSRTRNTDPVRHNIANFRISMARANAVARRLIRLGVPASKVAVTAESDNEPVYYEVMPSGEAGNRRAEIFLDY